MITLTEYIKKNKRKAGRCLYVGKGPSAKHANKYRNFGDVCVINEASSIVKGEIDYAVVVDFERLEGMRPDWNRIKTFFVPDKLIRNGKTPGDAPIQSVKDFPLEKAVVFPSRFWIPHHKRNIDKMFRKRKLIYPNTVTVGFHILSILGYNDFYILGNDGGVGYAEGIPYPKENEHAVKTRNRDIKRIVLEYVIRLLSKRYKLKVRFWQLEDEKGLKIALLCPMRIGSQRLRDKLLQKIGNISLAERAMIIMK